MRAWRISVAIPVALACSVVLLSAGGAPGDDFDWTRAVGSPNDGTITDANPDPNTTDFHFSVGDIGTVLKVEIRFSARHTWDSDLTAALISPAATQLTLFSGIGGSGDDYQDTLFTDDADSNIIAGSPPYIGQFKPFPSDLASAFNGEDANGTWILRVVDDSAGDEGTLIAHNETVDWGEGPVTAQGTRLFITIPEPAASGLVVLALGGWLLRARRRRP